MMKRGVFKTADRGYRLAVLLLLPLLFFLPSSALHAGQQGPFWKIDSKCNFKHLKPVYGGRACGSGGLAPLVPDCYFYSGRCVSFAHACARHDRCYRRHRNRRHCDRRLYADLKLACRRTIPRRDQCYYRECMTLAKIYYQVVRKFGLSHY